MPFRETTFDNTYQTMPSTTWNYWNLIKFNEAPRDDGNLMWLMRKDQCMHCEDPGCLRACPADGAIVQYTNGIVDFQQENCIGCRYCISGCPFDIPKFNATTKKVYKCTLCSDRVGQGLEPACIKACPTGCLKFGTKTDMVAIAETRAEQLREHSGFAERRRLRSAVDRRHACHLRAARHHQAGDVRRPAGEPADPGDVHDVEAARETGRAAAGAARRAGGVLPLHHGRAEGGPATGARGARVMTTAVERFDDEARGG